jgi:hypothetical protein
MSAAIALILMGSFLVGCGSSKSSSSNTLPPPNIAGPWEFVAVAKNGSVTGVEVALTESQVLVNGVSQASGQLSASGAQIAFVSLATVNGNVNISDFGGSCAATVTSNNGLGPGMVTGFGETVTFSYTANGSVFNVTGTLSGDGSSIVNGTYTAQSGNACSDNGGQITGTKVSKISGTYQGAMCPLGVSSATCSNAANFSDTATATASESGSTLTVTLNFTAGPDAGTNLTMSGPVTGNAFSVSGTYQGQTVTYYGYYEQVYSSTVGASVPSLYFVNSSDPSVSVGTLGVPQG